MIEVIPASQLKVGDVFSTDGYKVVSVGRLMSTDQVSVECWLDASGGISKRAVLDPDFPCPLWRGDEPTLTHAERLDRAKNG